MSDPQPAALAISRVLLQILIVLNIIGGLVILLSLPITIFFEQFTHDFFAKFPSDHSWMLVPVVRFWMLLGAGMIAAVHVVLKRLLAIVETVREGDPFLPENAVRLNMIAWCLLAIQLLDLSFGVMAWVMNAAGSNIEWNWSPNGWLAVVLTFVLARVFEEGTRIRADLKAMI